MSGLWLYGIGAEAPGGAPLGEGVGGAAVAALALGGFVALVSAAPAEPPAPTRRHMLAHTAVLERAAAAADLLPVRFGTVAPAQSALERCLAHHEAQLRGALSGVAGCVELGLRAAWRDDVVYREIMAAEASLRALRDRLQLRPAAETYGARIELGRRVEAAVQARRASDAAAIAAALDPLAQRSVALATVDDSQVLHRAFLVRREEEARFDAAVAALEAAQGERLAFRYVGPVPPFNFVSLRAEWLGAPARG